MRAEFKNFIEDQGLDGFSEDFYQWIMDNAIDEYIMDDVCREDYQQDADSLEESSSDEYGNELVEECVRRGLISAFDVVDGEYLGDEDLKDLYAWEAYSAVPQEYGSYTKWFVSLYGAGELAHTVEGWGAYDEDKIIDEVIERDGYTPLATYNGKVLELEGDYFGYKIDADDRRDEAEVD